MKTCFKCSLEKPLVDFYAHPMMKDGRLNKCKECTKTDTQKHYIANPEKRREYEKLRQQTPERRRKALIYQERRRSLHPEKVRARNAVANAIRSGRLTRHPCEKCGESKTQAHHHDYSRPLDVQWFCFPCHRIEHGQEILTRIAS